MNILLSPEDEHLRALPWYVTAGGYVRRSIRLSGKPSYEMLHRVVAMALPGQIVDHVNGDPLDNRRENLRICSAEENLRNRKCAKHNKLGLKGVFVHRGHYRAQIRINGKRIHLGDFCTPEDAKAAYDAAAVRYHGNFARLQ